MTTVLSMEGVEIIQKNYQQVVIRGDGKDQFNQSIHTELSILPPSENLEIIINEKLYFIFNYSFLLVSYLVSN